MEKKAIYFLGTTKGKSKKGNDYYAVLLLWLNAFGTYAIKMAFVGVEAYEAINTMDLVRGDAVSVSMDLAGNLEELKRDETFERLNLHCQRKTGNKG